MPWLWNRTTLKWLQMRRTASHRMKSRRLWRTTSLSTTTGISTDSTWKRNSPITASPLSRVNQCVAQSGLPPPPASISYPHEIFVLENTHYYHCCAASEERNFRSMMCCLVPNFFPTLLFKVIGNYFLCQTVSLSPISPLSGPSPHSSAPSLTKPSCYFWTGM